MIGIVVFMKQFLDPFKLIAHYETKRKPRISYLLKDTMEKS